MEAAGFRVEVHTHDYRATLPKAVWLAMMRARFWSTFSHCTAEELEAVSGRGGGTGTGQQWVRSCARRVALRGRGGREAQRVAALSGWLPAAQQAVPWHNGGASCVVEPVR